MLHGVSSVRFKLVQTSRHAALPRHAPEVNAHLISERRACAESITGPGRRPGGREVQRRVEAALLGGGLGALGLLVSGIVMWFPEAFGQVLRELSYVVHDVTFILFSR